MIKNYIKIAWRNLKKSKSFSILNIVGLSTGMACSILILLWVQNEVSYDQFHKDSERTYRFIVNAGNFNTAVASAGMAPDLRDELSEIESIVRTTKFETVLLDVNNTVYDENQFMYADANFLSFFDFPLVRGEKNTALTAPNTIVITASMAKKYFGEAEALGKTMLLNDSRILTVTGVLKDVPPNSHLKFDFISSIATIAEENQDIVNNTWGNFNYYAYMKLNKNLIALEGGVADLENKINAIADERMDNEAFSFRLQPLEDIHLHSNLQMDVQGHGNIQYVNIFFIVALFILVVACINFMNLSTARSAKRAKEVGLRKAIGAQRGQLVGQFLSESVLLSLISLIIAIGLVFLALPYFNNIAGKTLSLDLTNSNFWWSLIAIVLVTGVFAGSYPALYLSGFNPVKVLQGNLKKSGGNLFFRNGLVTLQFVISAVLIVGTGVVYNQLNFIKEKNLGFEKDNMIVVPFRGEIAQNQDALRTALKQDPLLGNYAIFSDMPTNLDTGTTDLMWEGKDENDGLVVPDLRIDENFIDLFNIEIMAGRGFSEEFEPNDENFIINETLMKVMGKNLDNIIGSQIESRGNDVVVVGVVKDFHFKPLQYDIEPLFITERTNGNYVAIQTSMHQTKASLAALEKLHGKLNPAFPFMYSFLDEDLEHMYHSEQQMGMIFNILAILAIFISCLGIYGLSAFMAEQRIKEIGIRKVLGATTIALVNLLSKDFFKLVLLGLIIAIPLSWYYLNEWLQAFAYHINISWWMFAMAGVVVLMITLVTVSYQSIRTALANPVESLRTE